jgi:hypothetical protein
MRLAVSCRITEGSAGRVDLRSSPPRWHTVSTWADCSERVRALVCTSVGRCEKRREGGGVRGGAASVRSCVFLSVERFGEGTLPRYGDCVENHSPRVLAVPSERPGAGGVGGTYLHQSRKHTPKHTLLTQHTITVSSQRACSPGPSTYRRTTVTTRFQPPSWPFPLQ